MLLRIYAVVANTVATGMSSWSCRSSQLQEVVGQAADELALAAGAGPRGGGAQRDSGVHGADGGAGFP